jgi:hypothetical protein
MTKTLFKITFAAVVALGAYSCKKNNLVIDQDIEAPAYAKFNVKAPADTAQVYYIRNTNAPFKIPIGVTNVSSVDRTINLSYTSRTAVAGQQYNAPTSVVIPAGQTLDTLEVQGLFAGYASATRIDTLYIKITGGDVPASSYWKGYRLIMRKYCDVDINAFDGDYDGTLEYTAAGAVGYGPYTTSISNITTTGATTATATIDNLYDYGGAVNATFDWTNPAAFRVTIAEQNTGALVVSGGVTYALWIRTNGTSSTFSSCENTVTVFIDAIAKNPTTGVSAGNFSTNYKITMFR